MQIINRTLRDCTNITPGDIQQDLHLHREDDASDMKVKKTKKTYTYTNVDKRTTWTGKGTGKGTWARHTILAFGRKGN